MSKTPTDEMKAVDVYDLSAIRQRLLDTVAQLRQIDTAFHDLGKLLATLDKLATKLDQLAQNMKPPELHEVLAELDAPYAIPNTRYLAERLTEAIPLVSELMMDAEITGSRAAYDKARAWLEKLGILVSD